jgi:hypothetical protein
MTKHWTLQLADEYKESGFKYAIFDRRSKGDGYHQGINNLTEMYSFLDKAYDTAKFSENKPRVALSPGHDEKEFLIMWYPEDGSYWVRGKVIILENND